LLMELVALAFDDPGDPADPALKKVKQWSAETVMGEMKRVGTSRHKTMQAEMRDAREKVAARVKKAKSFEEEEEVAKELQDATETFLTGLKQFREQDKKERSKALDDILGDSPSVTLKRKFEEEVDLEQKFEAVDELRKKWKAATNAQGRAGNA